MAGKNTYYVARRVFRKNLPYVAQNQKKHTLLKDMLYDALSPDQPPQSDLLHPPQQMVLALDMSYLLTFSHLTPTDQTVIFPMKFLRAFAHFTLTFIPIFLVHLFHSVTVLFFSFSYALLCPAASRVFFQPVPFPFPLLKFVSFHLASFFLESKPKTFQRLSFIQPKKTYE